MRLALRRNRDFTLGGYAALVGLFGEYAYVLLIIAVVLTVMLAIGWLLLLPFGIFATALTSGTKFLSTKSQRAAMAFLAIGIAIPVVGWSHVRANYQRRGIAIRQRIETAPRLKHVSRVPNAILVHDHPFPDMIFGRMDCFPRLFTEHFGQIGEWGAKGREASAMLPDRYVELMMDERIISAFGDRQRTGRRGPYELWLVEDGHRTLIDVMFIEGDGLWPIPPLDPISWIAVPATLGNRQLDHSLRAFLNRTTAQCAER